MKTYIKIFIFFILLIMRLSASPIDIMIGSRGYGMGGAYVAITNDASSAYWNPAGLSHLSDITIMESNWILQDIEGLNINYASVAIPIKNVGTVSGSWLLTHATLEEGWDYTTSAPKSSESANEHAFSLSIGRQLWDKLLIFEKTSLGFSINRHTFKTDAGDGAGFGFDVGFQTRFPYGISLGFTARALGADVMGYKIDPELRFGIGYEVVIKKMHKIVVAVDGTYKMNRDYKDKTTLEPAKNNMKGYGGLEYSLLLKSIEVSLRGGTNGMINNTLGNYGYMAGFGMKFSGISIQYAFKGDTDPEVALGYGHRLSLIIGINSLIKMKEKNKNDKKDDNE